jgi:protein-tyrosine-phosphatase
MAEGFIREMLPSDLKGKVNVESAGIHASYGDEPMDYSVQNMNSFGIDISMHRARKINFEMINKSDLILVMDDEQKENIYKLLDKKDRVKKLSDFAPELKINKIDDPFGGDKNIYDSCALNIRECSIGVVKYIEKMRFNSENQNS